MENVGSFDDFKKIIIDEGKLVNDKIHIFNECEFNFELKLENRDSIFLNNKIQFKDCKFQKLYFDGVEFPLGITFLNCFASSAWFINCKFLSETSIHFLSYGNQSDVHNGTLVINDSIFKSQGCISSQKMTLNKVEGDLSIGHPSNTLSLEMLQIYKFKGTIGLVQQGNIATTNEPYWTSLNSLKILDDFDGAIFVHRAILKQVILTGLNTAGHVRFDLVKVNSLHICDYINRVDGGLQLNRVTPLNKDSSFKIISSTLGKSYFSSCDLSAFSEFKYFDSDLSQVISNNTYWTDNILIEEDRTIGAILPDLSTEQDKLTNLENYYRTVKVILRNAGEKLGENYFRSKELDIKLQQTPWEQGNFLNKIALSVSQIFSNHGTNWLKPVCFMIMINVTIIATWNFFLCADLGFKDMLQLFNPAHKVSALTSYEEIERSWFIGLDFLSRLTTSYLAFQTIKAFRKFI